MNHNKKPHVESKAKNIVLKAQWNALGVWKQIKKGICSIAIKKLLFMSYQWKNNSYTHFRLKDSNH